MDSLFSFAGFKGATSSPDTAEKLALEAMDFFNRGNYNDALEAFEDIQERFPFSQYSLLADLKAADSNYYLHNYAEAIAMYKEFASSHPTNEAIPYIMFQVAMGFYQQIDTIDRDPGAAIDAIGAFTKLLKAFPSSPYTEESLARKKAARNFLANHEFHVATFYIRTGKIDQAEGRLRSLLLNYPESKAAQEAKEIVAAIDAGNPPERTWRDWIPDISLPDWHTFTSFSPGKISNRQQ